MTDGCMGCRVPGYSHAAYCPEGRVEDLRSRLAAVLEWLKDPRLSQWPYMENGDFYDDLSEQVAAIEKTLCTPDSAPEGER